MNSAVQNGFNRFTCSRLSSWRWFNFGSVLGSFLLGLGLGFQICLVVS